MHNPIVTVRHVDGSDSSRGARLAGDIIKQRFCQTTIVGSAFCSLKISFRMSLYRRALSSIRTPYTSLFIALKSASIKRIARSLETSRTPNIFSNITERPFNHRSNTMPFFRGCCQRSCKMRPLTELNSTMPRICAIYSNSSLVAASISGGNLYIPSRTDRAVGEVAVYPN